MVPHMMVSSVARDEAAAARTLRLLADIETQYAKTNPSRGYTCVFATLKAEAASIQNQSQQEFPSSDSYMGYKYSLTGCEVGQTGVVLRYKATAVPLVPTRSGYRAFCIDQSMELRYGLNEHPETCRSL